MGIRKINDIKVRDNNIIKIVKESDDMYENEKYAYNLLKENIPKFIECDDNTNTITIEKIKGTTLKEVEITDEIIIKLAKAIKKLHNHTNDGKVFVHGDLHKENILYYNKQIYFIDFCCSKYDIPEVDYSALEIHVLDTKEQKDLFYRTLGINANSDLLKREKVKHCLNHLTWATIDNFKNINIKSKKIIEENDELLEEYDFDYLGLIKLNNSEKIEKLVSKINDNLFVSRSKEYYKKKTYNGTYVIKEKPLPTINNMTLKSLKLTKGATLSTDIATYIVEAIPEEAKIPPVAKIASLGIIITTASKTIKKNIPK